MKRTISLLFVAVALGLAWAMRGHFGHEWGASWAGAMGAMALLLISNRNDWIRRAPALAAFAAIGWGAGGMMSYGIVVGYCRSISYHNALYGYAMLAVIGGLYGFLGGGLFGLGLESTEKNKPKWANLMAQMAAGGLLVWGFLIFQMEWFMTPPRSELWAGCFGGALALAWFLYRNDFKRALRVAGYAALGAGFGFSFGNFLQLLGSVSEISYNWWNVMEFSLGFFGGLGMAYGVLSRQWPESVKPTPAGNWIALAFVFLFIPITNFADGFPTEKFLRVAEGLAVQEPELYASRQKLFGGIALLLFALLGAMAWKYGSSGRDSWFKRCSPLLFFIIAVHYCFFSYLKLGAFYRPFSLGNSESLYVFIILILLSAWHFLLRKESSFPVGRTPDETWKRWGIIMAVLIGSILVITLISVNIHPEIPGAHNRF